MMELYKAIQYEEEHKNDIKPEDRPAFHLTPLIGWMNDPNGFCYYEGKYHMFYQYHPYSNVWGPMHWGHAVSKDLLHWEYLPTALAPDQKYDQDGCFSGSAITMPDGKHLLIYTSVDRTAEPGQPPVDLQTQSIAVGDGITYTKYEHNPVIDRTGLPEGASAKDFRDPKIVRMDDGTYRLFCVTDMKDGGGAVLQFTSEDAYHWKYMSTVSENKGRLGKMWECPDFFEMDGKYILSASVQEAFSDGNEYENGYLSFFEIGSYDEKSGKLIAEYDRSVDYGPDFYAQQTVVTPDGRRVMIGWMANWDTVNLRTEEKPWYGQMTLPREIFFRDGVLCQLPIKELETLRGEKISYENVRVSEKKICLDLVKGRMLDLEIEIEPEETLYDQLEIRMAEDEKFFTSLVFDRKHGKLILDRRRSGSRHAAIHTSQAPIGCTDGKIKLRVILDRFSIEVFVNDGERAMTMALPTAVSADGISFSADGSANLKVTAYPLH